MKQAVGAILVVMLIIINIGAYVAINVPAGVKYSNLFGSYVTLAYTGQPTFDGIASNIQHIYQNMQKQFPTDRYDYNTTYNTWTPWGHVYENSLEAQKLYLLDALNRTKYYNSQFNSTSNSSVKLTDTYNLAITNLRNELRCSQTNCRNATQQDGLDWVLRGAWYLNYAPAAYWDGYILIPVDIVLIIIAWLLIASNDY